MGMGGFLRGSQGPPKSGALPGWVSPAWPIYGYPRVLPERSGSSLVFCSFLSKGGSLQPKQEGQQLDVIQSFLAVKVVRLGQGYLREAVAASPGNL